MWSRALCRGTARGDGDHCPDRSCRSTRLASHPQVSAEPCDEKPSSRCVGRPGRSHHGFSPAVVSTSMRIRPRVLDGRLEGRSAVPHAVRGQFRCNHRESVHTSLSTPATTLVTNCLAAITDPSTAAAAALVQRARAHQDGGESCDLDDSLTMGWALRS